LRQRARVATFGPFQLLLSLEKSWHIFHYLFTGHADDAAAPGDALLSGTPIGETAGYEPARLQDERACRSFRDFLAPLDVDRLVTRMDFVRMASLGIYPLGGDMDPADEQSWRDEISQRFPELKTYVDQASDRGDGLLIWTD